MKARPNFVCFNKSFSLALEPVSYERSCLIGRESEGVSQVIDSLVTLEFHFAGEIMIRLKFVPLEIVHAFDVRV